MTRRLEKTHIYIFFTEKYFSVLTFISSMGTILNKSLVDMYSSLWKLFMFVGQ